MSASKNDERAHHVLIKIPRPIFRELRKQAKKNMRQPGAEAACIVVDSLKSE